MSNPSPLAFRVWDALKGEYLKDSFTNRGNWYFLDLQGKLFKYRYNDEDESHFFEELTELLPDGSPRYVVERGTGKKDIHDTNVYEGDRLIWDNRHKFVIIWDRWKFRTVYDDGDNTNFETPEIIKYSLIIGNVHEEGGKNV